MQDTNDGHNHSLSEQQNQRNTTAVVTHNESSMLGALQVLAATASNDQLRYQYQQEHSFGIGGDSYRSNRSRTSSDRNNEEEPKGDLMEKEVVVTTCSKNSTSVYAAAEREAEESNQIQHGQYQDVLGDKSSDDEELASRTSGSSEESISNKTGLRKGKWTVSF